MGASEGTYQPERGFKNGAGDFSLVAGARYHPYRLATILWERKNVTPVDIFIEVIDGDRVYGVDQVLGCICKLYAWPNSASPFHICLVPDMRVRFRVTGAVAGELQSAVIVWAELGAI